MDLGKKLKNIRKSKKISIYKLSQTTGISQGHISDLENGKNQPTIDTLKKLVVPLGITLSDFFNENDNVIALSDNEKELVASYRTMPDDKAELYLMLGKALQSE